MQTIQIKQITLINNETLTYREIGDASEVVVLVHGNLASSFFYRDLMEELAERFRVIAIDLRGFGDSTYHRPINSLRDFAGDLKLFVDALGLISFDLLGWSTGGGVSMYFTSMYPRYVKRLFLIASASVSGYHSYATSKDNTKVKLISKAQIENDSTKQALLNMIKNKDIKAYQAVWDNAIYNINKPHDRIYHQQLIESMKQQNLMDVYYALACFNISCYYNGLTMGSEEVDNIHCLVTIIHGEDDQLITVAEAQELQQSIGENAELIVVKDCGHSVMVDALDVIVEAVNRT